MGQFQADKRTILSIYPMAREIEQKHMGITLYSLPEVDKNNVIVREPMVFGRPMRDDIVTPCRAGEGYVLLNVYDTFQYVRDYMSDEERSIPLPISADVVANALVEIWGNATMNVQFGPGIMVIAGETPTAAELEHVRTRQHNYFVALVQDADAKHRKGGSDALNISDIQRRACTYLGVDREWNKKIALGQTFKDCIACGKEILGTALVCEHCSTNIVRFYEEELRFDPDPSADPRVYEMLQRRRAAAKTAPSPEPQTEPALPTLPENSAPKPPVVPQFPKQP